MPPSPLDDYDRSAPNAFPEASDALGPESFPEGSESAGYSGSDSSGSDSSRSDCLESELESESSEIDEIEGIWNETIDRYFGTINAGDFEATAALFAPDGALIPPFEEPVVGAEAIAAYLHNEATGMHLYPRSGESESLDTGHICYQVKGYVKTSLFGVNVGWIFELTPENTIHSVRIKLLASPQELLSLRR